MPRKTAESTFQTESGDQQGTEAEGGRRKPVQSHHESEIERNGGFGAQLRQFQSAAAQGTAR